MFIHYRNKTKANIERKLNSPIKFSFFHKQINKYYISGRNIGKMLIVELRPAEESDCFMNFFIHYDIVLYKGNFFTVFMQESF